MFFEFESSSNILSQSRPQPKSPCSTISSAKSTLSPLAIDSTPWPSPSVNNTNISNHRHRRYSMHGCQTSLAANSSLPLETLKENSLCDLALITKKKLMSLSGSVINANRNGVISSLKSMEERFVEPDIKLKQTFTKHSSSDLRKEVLLASIQRSLSASNEDLSSSSRNGNFPSCEINRNIHESDNSENNDDPMDSTSTVPQIIKSPSWNNSLESVNKLIQRNQIPIPVQPQKKAYRQRSFNNEVSYMPSETHVNLNSMTTFTSTTSMAGGSKNNNSPVLNNCFLTNMGSYYSRTSTPNPTSTVQSSPIRTSLKKRHYSASPSKYSSNPYYTQAQSIVPSNNKDSIYSNAGSSTTSSGQMSSDWEIAFKRLKVVHNEYDSSVDSFDPINDNGATTCQKPQLSNQQSLNDIIYGPGTQQNELNQLAQDFHRLKTPFS